MTGISNRKSLTQESWEALFDFLDPGRRQKLGSARDREAEAKCHEITRKLACFFAGRGCREAEDLAMETMLRVAGKCAALDPAPASERMAYFYGVARNVLLEWARDTRRESAKRESAAKDPTMLPAFATQTWDEQESAHRCLESCMSRLTQRARRLVLSYYHGEKGAKVDGHKVLAGEFGKSVNALRIEVHRIRKTLRRCVLTCLESRVPVDPLASAVRERT